MNMPSPTLTATTKRAIESESLTPVELKTFMNKHGLSIKEFAQILGVTIQAIRMWLSGDRNISVTISRLIGMFEKYPQLIKDF